MNNKLRRSIQQILLAGTTAAITSGAFASAGIQNPPPGPGQIPDYFGITGNFANSPQPILTKVVVNEGQAGGIGASVTPVVTNGVITNTTNLIGGSGYVNPTVVISDVATGSGFTGTVTIGKAAPPGLPLGALTNAQITIKAPGAKYSPNAKVTFTDPTGKGSGAVATVILNSTGGIAGFNFSSAGSGYSTGTTVTVTDVAGGTGAKAIATTSGNTAVNGKYGVITGIQITNGGSGYRSPTFTITDTAVGGSGAVLVATTYDGVNGVPTDKIMDVQVLNPGINYDINTKVTVTGGPGVLPVSLTPIIVNGGITGFSEIPNATNPVPNFAGLGKGFNVPIAGSGIRKFVDQLSTFTDFTLPVPAQNPVPSHVPNNLGQHIPIAHPDQTTFPGSDYYEIGEVLYTQKMHSDLPATHLRGYVQLVPGTHTPVAAGPQYMGPIIVAQKGIPVRIKVVNLLPPDASSNLPFPVDTTYMGQDGSNDSQNRTSVHLHGGNTPWISDGTARQWFKPSTLTPANDATNKYTGAGPYAPGQDSGGNPNKGESARSVPDMWYDKTTGNLVPNSATCTQGTTVCTTPNATNDVDGQLTFFYTNEQSARLMFYHEHAEGITRLGVYAGLAAPYLLQDLTEQALVTNGTLPSLDDTIPVVIQDKTFVPDSTQPVLNFYGPFASQLQSQDPTWRWGTGTLPPVGGLNGNGDLWVPHVFMTNQNPGTTSGANNVGRWDYGPWFWPPFVNLQNGALPNPYYDSTCNTTISFCEPSTIPGVPNGSQQSVLSNNYNPVLGPVPGTIPGGVIDHSYTPGTLTESPSGTPEAFNDTPIVNGTAYPFVKVDPKKYRLRILSVADDRTQNLSLVVAASNKSVNTTAAGNSGTTNNTILCDGSNGVSDYNKLPGQSPECTEIKMVPWTSAQDSVKPFPYNASFDPTKPYSPTDPATTSAKWYTPQNGGVTFDGRPSGVFDPATRGPAMIQIGSDGGFLSTPHVSFNQPINYEYNLKNILVTNVKEKALVLGPAERADVLVDFSHFAGATLILFNDAPAAFPAFDLRLDYYTGGSDNTDTGGAFSVVPGYGPNTRTIMQFRVNPVGGTATASTHQDDISGFDIVGLTSAIQAAFKTSQEPIIVPQSTYNAVYGINAPDALGVDLLRIADYSLTYTPLDPATRQISTLGPITLNTQPKSIIEDWTQNWGRMNALLGVEIPRTTSVTQTSIPQAYVDPPTELVKITPNDNMIPINGTAPDGSTLWRITHNGVDTHAIHFHLFHVQVINRIGWDGAVYAPDANELGWKDIVRMNPLSDTLVALRPMTMTSLPFKVPNSHRLLMPNKPLNASATANGAVPPFPNNQIADFFNLDPTSGNGSNITNVSANFGWEYLWHCHILGHEENDMMRTISAAQPPEAPVGLTVAPAAAGSTGVTLSWTDNSMIANWVTIQRSTDSSFTPANTTVINVLQAECTSQQGCPRTYNDPAPGGNINLYYRIRANNTVGAGRIMQDGTGNLPLGGLTPNFTGYSNVTANSGWTNQSSGATAVVNRTSLTFPGTAFNTVSTPQTVTLNNTGSLALSISGISTTAEFAQTNNCGSTLLSGASCSINVTFNPTSGTVTSGLLTLTDNSSTGTTQIVSLVGSVITGPTPPAAVAVNRSSTTTAVLSWVDASNNETSFQPQTSVDGGNTWSNVGPAIVSTAAQSTATGTAMNINITVADTTNASYRVMVFQSAVSAPPLTLTVVTLNDTVAPSAPTGLTGAITTGKTSTVKLNWTLGSNNNASYTLQSSTNGLTWTTVTSSLAGNVNTYSQTYTPTSANTYFRIQGVNAKGASGWSNTLKL